MLRGERLGHINIGALQDLCMNAVYHSPHCHLGSTVISDCTQRWWGFCAFLLSRRLSSHEPQQLIVPRSAHFNISQTNNINIKTQYQATLWSLYNTGGSKLRSAVLCQEPPWRQLWEVSINESHCTDEETGTQRGEDGRTCPRAPI